MRIFDQSTRIVRLAAKKRPHFVSAVIVAGGNGSRMNSLATKQMMMLCGMPVIIRTLAAFEASDYIDEIILVAKQDEIEQYPSMLEQYGIKKVSQIVAGGQTRQDSVLSGFEAIHEKADFVAIHDGARPLITPDQIKTVLRAAFEYRAAAAATPATDSAKEATVSAMINRTLDRKTLWMVQTPQVFYANLYRAAAYTAKKDSFVATDDTEIAEHAGFSSKLVNIGYDNIKLTTPVDLLKAEAILNYRKMLEETQKGGNTDGSQDRTWV